MIDAESLTDALKRIPAGTLAANGLSGRIKSKPEHFLVEETMPYLPTGKGEHVYLTLRRSGWNTPDVARELGKILSVSTRDIGWAGMKDKIAVATQTFSLKMPLKARISEIKEQLTAETPFEVLRIDRHTNKIRAGHVRSNRFRIVLTPLRSEAWSGDDPLVQAQAIASEIIRRGLPNFYGDQRFGESFGNITYAAAAFNQKKIRKDRKGKFLISVLQAALFNIWLWERIERQEFQRIFAGDIAKKTDTGGLFVVEDEIDAQRRFDQKALTYTGPIYGTKTMPAANGPGETERALFSRYPLDMRLLKRLKTAGSRRAAVVWMDPIHIEKTEEGLAFAFELPSGGYATNVMREFTRAHP